jgi:hypothetical protein
MVEKMAFEKLSQNYEEMSHKLNTTKSVKRYASPVDIQQPNAYHHPSSTMPTSNKDMYPQNKGLTDELNNQKYDILRSSRKHIFAIENINKLP